MSKLSKSKFVRLHLADNWGHKYYRLFSQKGETALQDQQEIKFTGKKIRVKWPTGEVETLPIREFSYSSHVSDMGHSYTVGGVLTKAVKKVKGAEILFTLDQFAGVEIGG